MKTTLSINGRTEEIEHAPPATLLGYLRERIGLTGSKPGCWRGECGACTVLVDGRPRVACITLIALIPGADVRTVEGLEDETLELRRSFADHGGFQCGFCTPGQIVSAHVAIADGPADESELRHRMSGNICRCTGYGPIITAIETVGRE